MAVILILFFLVIPFLLGLWFVNVEESGAINLIKSWVYGFVGLLGVFEAIYIPCYFLHVSYRVTQIVYSIIVLLAILLLLPHMKTKWNILLQDVRNEKITLFLLLGILLTLFMTYVPAVYTNSDDDDAFYIATATTTQETNTMFRYNPYTGRKIIKVQDRYLLSPYPVFLAHASSISFVPAAVLAHRFLPIIYVPLAFSVFFLFGGLLFKNDRKKHLFFLLAVLLTLFSGYSIKNASVFLLYRIWQGKAVLAAVLLPVIWYVFARRFLGKQSQREFYAMLILLSLAGGMVSSMGIFLVPILIGVLSFVLGVYEKSLKAFILPILCAFPSVMLGLIYLFVL